MKIKEQIKRRFSEVELYNLCLAKFIIMEDESKYFHIEEIIFCYNGLLDKYESMEESNIEELDKRLEIVACKFNRELKEIKNSLDKDNVNELTKKIAKELSKYYNKSLKLKY